MVSGKFDKLYNFIMENFNVVGYKRNYKINDTTFKPVVYKDVYICSSALNEDINHILLRLNTRTKYTLNDLLTLVKLGIDQFYKNKYDKLLFANAKNQNRKIEREKTEQNFCILSKSKKDIKICILIAKNTAYDIFNDEHKDFYSSKYICFVNTVLDQNMTPKDNDIKLVTETNNEQINLYVV